MYETYYGLNGKPFALLPNPDFLYLSASHRKALTYLEYAISERAGFMLLTGEIGSGKTTVIRKLQQDLQEEIVFAKISYTMVDADQLIAMINEDFGLDSTVHNKVDSLKILNRFLIEQYAAGKKPLLVIDEAQNLSPEALENIRLLSNLETDDAKLLQILLVGQPELHETIHLPEMTQLRQRISVYCRIVALNLTETQEYIYHRLSIVGNRDAVKFTAGAMKLIWKHTHGIPRLINMLCDFLLLAACSDNSATINAALVKEIAADMGIEEHFWGEQPRPEAAASLNPAAGIDPVALASETKGLAFAADDSIPFENVGKVSEFMEKANTPLPAEMPAVSPQQAAFNGQSGEGPHKTSAPSARGGNGPEGNFGVITGNGPLVGERRQEKKGFFWRLFHAV